MVFGFVFVLKANRQIEAVAEAAAETETQRPKQRVNDLAFRLGAEGPVPTILRFHQALREITGRRGIRNDVSRYRPSR
jgi:hypothetical protein